MSAVSTALPRHPVTKPIAWSQPAQAMASECHLMKRIVLSSLVALSLSASSVQAATLTVSTAVGGAPTGVNLDNLNWLELGGAGGTNGPVSITFNPDAGAVQGAAAGLYAAPVYSDFNGAAFGDNYNGADQSVYISSGSYGGNNPNAAVEIAFSGYQKYFGLLWGSVDDYNTLSFYDGATWLGDVTGMQASLVAPTGDQGPLGTYYVNIVSDTNFNRVVARSSQYAFEFDNIAYNDRAPVAEPTTLLLLGTALVGVAHRVRRRS